MIRNNNFLKIPTINNNNSSNYNFLNFSKNILYKKYSSFKYSYSSICIKNLIFNEKCRIVSRFKEYLIYDDDTEFLRNCHEKKTLTKTYKAVIDYYHKYNKVFPNYMILSENVFMYKNIRRKQKMINERIKKKKIEKNKENNIEKNIKTKYNKLGALKIFDDKIKENINLQNNSMVTLSLTNTNIYNYINNNENLKKENNHNLIDFNSNNSSTISLYNTIFNNNNDNLGLYEESLKSESSIKNIVDILNNKKYKKLDVPHNKNRKNNKLSIDIVSNNHINNNKKNNNALTKNVGNQNYIIKTPTKNKLLKKERDIQQIYQVHHKSLNNNRTIFHKKNTSDIQNCGQMKSILTGDSLSKKRTTKFINKFIKENGNNIIEEINPSLIKKYISKHKNKNIKKSKDIKNRIEYSKNKENIPNNGNNEHIYTKISNYSKENKIIKVNNNFYNKKINKNLKLNDLVKNNINVKDKKRQLDEEDNNPESMKTKTIYELFHEKYKSNCNNIVKEKKKEIKKQTIDTASSESTKISLNRKEKYNCYINCDKINNNKNNIINEAIQTQPKEVFLGDINNLNLNNHKNIINNTENNCINKNVYVYENNLGKNNQKQNDLIENKKIIHKKHKTFSQILNNDFFLFNKDILNNDNKIHYFNSKLKIIKEAITKNKNKNNYKKIKDKFRKLSEDNQKNITYASSSFRCNKFEKMTTYSVFNRNNIDKKEKNNNNNKIYTNELNSKNNIQLLKRDNVFILHQRYYSNMNNDYKNPIVTKLNKEVTKKIFQINKGKIISTKRFNKKIKTVKNT